MATVGANYTTLVDLAKQMDPNGKPARIINIMAQKNAILRHMPFMQGNLPTGHLASVLVGLPTPTWRKLNGGTIPGTDSHAQLQEQCGLLDDWSQADVKLAKLSGDVNKFRMNRGISHLEGIAQEAARALFYGSRANPEQIVGLSVRYGLISGGGDVGAQNIIDAGGTGSDNASIWVVNWGEDRITGIYPQGSQAGIQHQAFDETVIQNAGGVTGALMTAYLDHWMWDMGLAVLDWRNAVRICNIDISNLVTKTGAADLPELLDNAMERLPDADTGNVKIYMNRTVKRMLRIQARDDVQVGGQLDYDVLEGKKIATWDGCEIGICDQLTNAETRVT